MVREFAYKGEAWRMTAHGIHGHEEVFIVHIGPDGTEGFENSIDRMTEPNDVNATLQDIIVMLCDAVIEDRGIKVSDPDAPFEWHRGRVAYEVHNGIGP